MVGEKENTIIIKIEPECDAYHWQSTQTVDRNFTPLYIAKLYISHYIPVFMVNNS